MNSEDFFWLCPLNKSFYDVTLDLKELQIGIFSQFLDILMDQMMN